MAEYLIQDSTLEDIADAIRAKTGDSGLINPEDMADEIDGIQTGGGVENGIVYSALQEDGRPTVVDFYGDIAYTWQFCGCIYGGIWLNIVNAKFHGIKKIGYECFYGCSNLESVSGLDDLTTIETGAFKNCTSLSQDIVIPSTVTLIGDQAFNNSAITSVVDNHEGEKRIRSSTYANCSGLETYRADKLVQFWGDAQFYGCSSLTDFSMGSVGYGIIEIQNTNTFSGCTNPLLNMVFYTKGNYVDTLLTRVRAGATAATIIIKASESTTYNNVSYTAGDTIVTSVPETTE